MVFATKTVVSKYAYDQLKTQNRCKNSINFKKINAFWIKEKKEMEIQKLRSCHHIS